MLRLTAPAPDDAQALDFFTWNRDFHGIRPRNTDDARSVKLTAAIITVAAEPVDFFTWNRDFHGIRPRDTDDERPAKVSTGVARVALAIAAHINSKSGEATLGTRRLAQAAQVSTGTVANALPVLEGLGWVQVERGKRANTKADATNTYRLTSPVAALRKAREGASGDEAGVPQEMRQGASGDEAGVPQEMRQGASGDEDELRSSTTFSTTRDQKTSPNAGASGRESASLDRTRRDGERTAKRLPLHPEWAPNNAHRDMAAKLGLDLDTEAAAFRAAFTGKSSNWGAKFTTYLEHTSKGDVADQFRSGAAAEAARSEQVALAVVRSLTAPTSPVRDETGPEVPATPDTDTDAPTDDTAASRWTFDSGAQTAPVIDHDAEAAQVAAMFLDAEYAEHLAERARWRRGRDHATVARSLRPAPRPAERVKIDEMLDGGATPEAVTAAIRAWRNAKNHEVARELAKARRISPALVAAS